MAAKNMDNADSVDVKKVPAAGGSDQKFTFFWGNKSPFSQWHPAKFVVEGVHYNCAEQYMMHQKAVLFNDDAMAKEILDAKEPKQQKSLGRAVGNFDGHVWKQKCRDIVKSGNMAKFSQNEDLMAQLLATRGTTLVEASPRDRIWGIGLGAQNPKARDPRQWRGKNWLGYVLTQVRDTLARGADAAPGKTKEKFTFFWGNKSCFSQWHPAQFTVDGIQYNCTEQYMMHQKAALFKDDEIAEAVMAVQEPRKQKSLGRRVSNFEQDTWDQHCRDIVKKGNKAKFTQNADLKKQLLATAGTTLVEASPHDAIWGIGLKCNDPRAQDRSTWQGTNWLGLALTDVRDEIVQEETARTAKRKAADMDTGPDSD